MNVIDVLVKQTKDAHLWTHKLLDSIPDDLWEKTPEQMDSNISWQVGHLVLTEYYHAIMVVTGLDFEIGKRIDIKSHNQQYGYGSVPKASIGDKDPKLLKEQLCFVQNKVIETISSLTLEDLESKVEESTGRKHPAAVTKFEAVSWNIKHTMWHCGQIAAIKRMLHGGFDFGVS